MVLVKKSINLIILSSGSTSLQLPLYCICLMCTSYRNTFILWLGQQSPERYIPAILHTNIHTAPWLEGLWRKKNKDASAHSGSAVVIPFFRDTLNNQCRLKSNPYSPYPCLQDIKHQLLCQILYRSQEWQAGIQMRHQHTHIQRVTHKLELKHTHTRSPSLRLTRTQIHIHPQKQSFFERGSGGLRGVQLAS